MSERIVLSRRAFAAGSLRLMGAMGVAALASSPFALVGCSEEGALGGSNDNSGSAQPATSSTFAFDTYCTFSVYGDDTAPARLARACARYDALFDLYNPESDIARVNASAGAPCTVDPATADLVSQALAWCEQAHGRFDITIGAVSTLWNFDEGVRPSDEAVAQALPHVNWHGVSVDTSNPESPTITLADLAAKLDLGGIAKGYIADRLCELLEQETTATGAAISLGGNIAYMGCKPDGSPWTTGIRDPNDPGGSTVVGTAQTAGGSLVTSGLYERTFDQDGTTYWHILDPRTGMPVATDVVSVTVACPSSTEADALSTTLFVAGSAEGARIVDARPDTAAYFILNDGSAVSTSRWQELTDFTTA